MSKHMIANLALNLELKKNIKTQFTALVLAASLIHPHFAHGQTLDPVAGLNALSSVDCDMILSAEQNPSYDALDKFQGQTIPKKAYRRTQLPLLLYVILANELVEESLSTSSSSRIQYLKFLYNQMYPHENLTLMGLVDDHRKSGHSQKLMALLKVLSQGEQGELRQLLQPEILRATELLAQIETKAQLPKAAIWFDPKKNRRQFDLEGIRIFQDTFSQLWGRPIAANDSLAVATVIYLKASQVDATRVTRLAWPHRHR